LLPKPYNLATGLDLSINCVHMRPKVEIISIFYFTHHLAFKNLNS